MKSMEERNPEVPEDPSGIEEPHDVLAAEEFGIGARDERLPPDPTGIQGPHDVLAAEEFAMPAGQDVAGAHSGSTARSWAPLLMIAAFTLALIWRRRSR
jgi:hypothetical protein